MPSAQAQKALKEIWDATSVAAPDGNRYLLFKGRDDLIYLYCCGFVDEAKFTVEDWVDAFEDSLMPTGAYMVGEPQWMAKSSFRYEGPVGRPFDPYSIREGEWSEAEMQALIKEKILPSVWFNEEEFRKIMEMAKTDGFYLNGKYRITPAFKADLLYLLNTYPSARRVREMRLDEAWARQMQKESPGAFGKAAKTSGFTTGKTPSEQAAERLTELVSKKGR